MGRRGPKSSAEKQASAKAKAAARGLESAPTALPQRPPPPRRLSAKAKRRWRAIVNEMPVDRLRQSDLRLLADLIQSEEYAAECDENIAAHGQLIGPGVQINPAVTLREKHMRIIVALQRVLRLPPSMRMQRGAAPLNRTAPKGKKPWET